MLNRQLEFQAGQGRLCVRAVVHETGGHGLCCVVTGGELAHIGGAAACYQSESAALTTEELSFPTHKDAVLAKQLAEKLRLATGQDVVAVVGIHVDHASSKDIQTLCDNALSAIETYLDVKEATY